MNWVYIQTEKQLWTTGFYDPDGAWQSDEDFSDKQAAALRVNYLNGGTDTGEMIELLREIKYRTR